MMALLKPGDLLIGHVLLTKRAAELSPSYTMIATDPRRSLQERIDAALAADAMSVALAQPRKTEDGLAAFCERLKLRRECRMAGENYNYELRAEKTARGFHVVDTKPGEGDKLTEAERAAEREAAIEDLRDSNAVLRAIHSRCPARMELLCFDRLHPSPYDEGILVNGLLNLARHYGFFDEGINRGKAI